MSTSALAGCDGRAADSASACSQNATLTYPRGMQVIERGWVSSNSIVFTDPADADGSSSGAEGTIGTIGSVVDTGYVRHAAQTVELVRHALAGAPLKRIVNTHTHSDHIGGNAALRAAWPDVNITIPAGDAGIVSRWDETALHLSTMGQDCERFAFDSTYTDADVLMLGGLSWRAIGSPGHHMASLMLYSEQARILISADALWENGFGVIFPEIDGDPASQGGAFAAQRATLEAIAKLDVTTVIPGHGAPFGNLHAALDRAQSRLDYFIANPERHARNGLKVTLAFLLMIEQRIGLDTLPDRLAALPLAARINLDHYQLEPRPLAEFVVSELEKSAVARRAEGWLIAK